MKISNAAEKWQHSEPNWMFYLVFTGRVQEGLSRLHSETFIRILRNSKQENDFHETLMECCPSWAMASSSKCRDKRYLFTWTNEVGQQIDCSKVSGVFWGGSKYFSWIMRCCEVEDGASCLMNEQKRDKREGKTFLLVLLASSEENDENFYCKHLACIGRR